MLDRHQLMKISEGVYVRTCGPQKGVTSHGHLIGLCPGDSSISVLVGKDSLPSLAWLPLHGIVCDKVVEVVLLKKDLEYGTFASP